MRSVITKEQQHDNVLQSRSGENLILTNERTGQTVTISRHSTPSERREAVKSLQPVAEDPFAGVSARQAVQKMYGTVRQEIPDPEPRVAMSGGILREKQLKAHDAWLARQQAKADRARQLEDENRLADKIADKLAKAEPETESPPVDWQKRNATTLELARVRANALSTQEQIAAAQRAADDAWGIVPQAEGSEAKPDAV